MDTTDPDKLYFRIGEVAEIVGVESHVLRYWEAEFRLRPHRSSSGHRLYRKQDIERFLRIRHLLQAEGFTISGARKVLLGQEPGSEETESLEKNTVIVSEPLNLRRSARRLEVLREAIKKLREDAQNGGFLSHPLFGRHSD